MTVQEILNQIEQSAPFALQESYDNAGLSVGDPHQTVTHILLTVDITTAVVQEAIECGADLIVAHHPVIWSPLRVVSAESPVGMMLRHGIAAICAHTNVDAAASGLNAYVGMQMAREIALQMPFFPLLPKADGASVGHYANCVDPVAPAILLHTLQRIFACPDIRYHIPCDKSIRRIAWCTGSGGDLLADAKRVGADVLITGDCKHSVWMEAHNLDCALIDCGHFYTEKPVIRWFAECLEPLTDRLILTVSEIGSQPAYQTLTLGG